MLSEILANAYCSPKNKDRLYTLCMHIKYWITDKFVMAMINLNVI